ncbi:MAG: serine hydrolase domain-containing protein [Prolixibacteraceae bacterium]
MKKKKLSLAVTFWGILLFLISCDKNNETESINNEIITEWENVSDSVLTNSGIPGMIIGIWAPDRNLSWVVGKGTANVSTGEKPDPSMKYRIASITKTFTYTVLLQLIEEGKLSLSDKLSKFLPDFPEADNVSVRMLCNHTSGIYDFSTSPGYNEQVMSDMLKKWNNLEFIDIAADNPYYFSPGTAFKYSNSNTILASYIIEKLTEHAIGDEIKQRILTPLNLTNTFYPTDRMMPTLFIHGYEWDSETTGDPIDVSELLDPSFSGGAGSMVSNIYDLKSWVEHLYKGTLLKPETQVLRMETIPAPGEDCEEYGLGIMYKTDPPMWGHTGTIYGYKHWMGYCPSENLTMVISYNCTTSKPMELANRLLRIYNRETN